MEPFDGRPCPLSVSQLIIIRYDMQFADVENMIENDKNEKSNIRLIMLKCNVVAAKYICTLNNYLIALRAAFGCD